MQWSYQWSDEHRIQHSSTLTECLSGMLRSYEFLYQLNKGERHVSVTLQQWLPLCRQYKPPNPYAFNGIPLILPAVICWHGGSTTHALKCCAPRVGPRTRAGRRRHRRSDRASCGGGADLEWRLTYVGDAESEVDDQVLDSVLVGPVYPGQYRFVFQVLARPSARPPVSTLRRATEASCTGLKRWRPGVESECLTRVCVDGAAVLRSLDGCQPRGQVTVECLESACGGWFLWGNISSVISVRSAAAERLASSSVHTRPLTTPAAIVTLRCMVSTDSSPCGGRSR